MEMIRKLLVFIKVVQIADNKKRTRKLGRGYSKAYRINPFNPLSYLALLIFYPIAFFLFGFVGAFKEGLPFNPFKWV